MKKILLTFLSVMALQAPLLVSSDPVGSAPPPNVVAFNGVIAQGAECDGIRRCDNSDFYVAGNIAGYSYGDEVFVVGRLNYDVISFCQQGPHLGVLHIHRSPCN